jgi:hypothetical protein
MQTWVGRQKEMDEVEHVLKDAVTGGRNHLVFFVGDYGLGKTMTLLRTVDVARELFANKILAFHTSFISPEKVANPGIYLIFKILRGIIQAKPQLRLKLASDRLSELHPDIANVFKIAFSRGQDGSLRRTALDFLCGTIKPTQGQMKALNIIRKIDTFDVALEYLVALLFVLKQAGIVAVVGAIDEFEYLFSLATRAAQPIYLALLREIHDLPSKLSAEWVANMSALALFFGVSEDGWRIFLELEETQEARAGPITPLKERITTIFLSRFDRKTSEELVKRRLSLDRTTGKYKADPLIPFTSDFVDFITEKSDGRPKWIIVFSDHVLDAGLEHRVKVLNKNFARRVLTERGLIGEELKEEVKTRDQ